MVRCKSQGLNEGVFVCGGVTLKLIKQSCYAIVG